MTMKLTAVFMKVPEGCVRSVEQLPGANTQARTLDDARQSLKEAVDLVLEANKELIQESLEGKDVIRESISVSTA